MRKTYLTNNPSQTKKLGEKIAKEIIKKATKNKAIVLGLEGDLGGGKTTFLQGFAKGLGVKEKILSPTFIIMRKFQIPPSTKFLVGSQITKFKTFYHFDCYRVVKSKEILNLGFKKIISNPQNIVAAEWAEKIKNILPKTTPWIKFNFINRNTRQVIIKGNGRG